MLKNTLVVLVVLIFATTAAIPGEGPGSPSPSNECMKCYYSWMSSYATSYGFEYSQYRLNIFTRNYNEIVAHNRLRNVTFRMGVNQWTGLTQQEFQNYALGQEQNEETAGFERQTLPPRNPPNADGIIPGGQGSTGQGSPGDGSTGPAGGDGSTFPGYGSTFPGDGSTGGDGTAPGGDGPLPDFPADPNGLESTVSLDNNGRLLQQNSFAFNFLGWDWRGRRGAVSSVKNQGKCGSCYAFAAVAAVESAIMVRRGYWMPDLSEQQIVDCTGYLGNQGCNGGYKGRSIKYAVTNGLVSESAYPYKASKSWCKYNQGYYKIKGVTTLRGCGAFRRAVRRAPVAVSVSASGWSGWKNYANGVIQCPRNAKVNHAVLLVGYTEQLHWIIKNSWGTKWGEKGYIKVDVFKNCNICKKIGAQAQF